MNDVNSAARSFFVLAEVARLLAHCYDRGLNLDYQIKLAGPKPPLGEPWPENASDSTDIHITIRPGNQPAPDPN